MQNYVSSGNGIWVITLKIVKMSYTPSSKISVYHIKTARIVFKTNHFLKPGLPTVEEQTFKLIAVIAKTMIVNLTIAIKST